MDLFVINRYREDEEEVNEQDRETKNLQKLKQRIEERKKNSLAQKPLEITLKAPPEIKHEDSSEEQEIPEIKEDIQGDFPESREAEVKKPKKEKASEFKVLGSTELQKKITVKRLLPNWLSNFTAVSTNLQQLSCEVEQQTWLHSTLRSTLLAEGITRLFPVQELVVPFVLREHRAPHPLWPRDVCVSAPTGSGKTLSFVLPIIQVLAGAAGRRVRALVVLPVRELAAQVARVFSRLGARSGLRVALLSGAVPLAHEQRMLVRHTETAGWISDVDIIVSTPGRLVEHLQNTEGLSLKHLKFLVIDEADRIMNHIQNDWLYHLERYIQLEDELMTGKQPACSWGGLGAPRRPPHKLLFSATLSQDPEQLDRWSLFQPQLFSAAPRTRYEEEETVKQYSVPDELEEEFVVCGAQEKPLILYHLLVEQRWRRALVFTNSGQSAHRLAALLTAWAGAGAEGAGVVGSAEADEGAEGAGAGEGAEGLRVAELSSALDRATRDAVLKNFKQSKIDAIICTDALARGIDLPRCDHVISYDPPRAVSTHVHRAGRTGRAGRRGRALTVLLPAQVNGLKETLKYGPKSLPTLDLPTDLVERLSDSYERAIEATKHLITEEITNKVKKSIALKRGPKPKVQKRKGGAKSDAAPESKKSKLN